MGEMPVINGAKYAVRRGSLKLRFLVGLQVTAWRRPAATLFANFQLRSPETQLELFASHSSAKSRRRTLFNIAEWLAVPDMNASMVFIVWVICR